MPEEAEIRDLNARLDRFENNVNAKLEMLTEALIKLARTEEKIYSIEREIKDLYEKNLTTTSELLNTKGNISTELTKIKQEVQDNTRSMNSVSKFFWLVIAALISTGTGVVATIFL